MGEYVATTNLTTTTMMSIVYQDVTSLNGNVLSRINGMALAVDEVPTPTHTAEPTVNAPD